MWVFFISLISLFSGNKENNTLFLVVVFLVRVLDYSLLSREYVFCSCFSWQLDILMNVFGRAWKETIREIDRIKSWSDGFTQLSTCFQPKCCITTETQPERNVIFIFRFLLLTAKSEMRLRDVISMKIKINFLGKNTPSLIFFVYFSVK